MSELRGYSIDAEDGNIGTVTDFYFNDENWRLIYIVIDTGKWLSGRKVLMARKGLGQPNWEKQSLSVRYKMEFIKNSPSIDTEKPVSRQKEIDLFKYFNWDPYWGVLPSGDKLHTPPNLLGDDALKLQEEGDLHLRSFNELKGYTIKAFEGKSGNVEDFIIEDNDWSIPMLVVSTKEWLPSKKVLLPTESIEKVKWENKSIEVNLTENAVNGAPEYDPSQPVSHKWVSQLYDYYGRPVD